ncbi:hypothetical protein CMI46_01855 [Candidatus Pacearchaeota archaeon]|nr:hypothetical protein [Candidatus Pacearchaeota archaeon]|tara:strand:- start:2631 stop:3233 length:603 start_codon:yes stop_codon:yes gene_type:complete
MDVKNNAYAFENDTIVIDRNLTDLDIFVRDFLNVLKPFSNYLIVSGFVSIATGRARGTEDVDILVPVMDKSKFGEFFNELTKNDFWCYQGENIDDVYSYIEKMINIRFAKKDEMFPNMEFISIDESKKTKYFEFTHPQKIKISDFEFNIPPIEFEILYKEIILKSKKDIADAQHLRVFFSNILDDKKFKEYKSIIEEELK